MRLSWGLLLLLVGVFALICRAKPTDADVPSSPKSDKNAEDDSDMLMEPDDFSHISVIRSEGHQVYPTTTEYEHPDEIPSGFDSHSQAAQNFYPNFFREPPPLGHSRPYYSAPDGSTIGKTANSRSFDPSILGSGDFGVIRGGTFYSDDEAPYHSGDDSEFNQFYGDNLNNGHGRPQQDAYVQKFTYPEEQFANFRDFADINTPSDPAYSQFVVVYANKNSTSSSSDHPNPKNIFEQLELLDKEKGQEEKKNRTSKTKDKLASTKLEKKYKKKLGPKDLDYEPLLALS